jgi:hypothetical protein
LSIIVAGFTLILLSVDDEPSVGILAGTVLILSVAKSVGLAVGVTVCAVDPLPLP